MILRYIENKKIIDEPISPVFDLHTDILVAGLGSAGSVAAITAAKMGSRVIGIDRTTSIGGLSTAGCVWDYYYGCLGGEGDSINDRCRALEERGYLKTYKGSESDSFSSAVRTYALEQAAEEAGVQLMYETLPTGVYMEGNRAVGVRCLSNGKTINISFKAVIDSTGDIWLARLAGAEVRCGRESDGKSILCSNTAVKLYENKLNGFWDHCSIDDCTDSETFSDVILSSAEKVPFLDDWFEEKDRLIYLGSILGERDAPRIVGEENLSFEGYADGYRTDKPLFYAVSQVDDVNFDISNSSVTNQDWRLISAAYYYGISLGVPIGALIPKGLEGILVACKGIAIDYDLLGCYRMRRNVEKCGEAAAAAAHLAIRDGISASDVDYGELSAILRKSGCLQDSCGDEIYDLKKPLNGSYEQAFVPKKYEDIKKMLEQKSPEMGFWAVRISKDAELINHLREWMAEKDETLRVNCAVALGLRGNNGGIDILREIVDEGPKALKQAVGWAFEYQPYTAALCILGRLGDCGDAERLMKAACKAPEYARIMPFEAGSYFKQMADWEFFYTSLAVSAAVQIAYKAKSPQLDEFLMEWLDEGKYPIGSRKLLYRESMKKLVEIYLERR